MKISDLRITFDDFTVYIDELKLDEEKIYGLIGSNGCGKTTLINAVAGINRSYTGVIDYEGLSVKDITLVPRRPYMLHTTVLQNLIYPLKLRGIKPDPRQVKRCLETLGISGEQYAPGLSGGQKQKLALMRSMFFSPKLILLDEAFSNLDIESVELFERMIKEHQQRSPAIWLIVSHQMSSVSHLCEYIFFMNNGLIKACGNTRDILSRPEDGWLKYLRYESMALPSNYDIF